MEQVVEHYSRWADGLPEKLQVPVSPTQSFESPNRCGSSSQLVPPPLPRRTPRSSPNGVRLDNSLSNVNNNSEADFIKGILVYAFNIATLTTTKL